MRLRQFKAKYHVGKSRTPEVIQKLMDLTLGYSNGKGVMLQMQKLH